MEKVGDMKFIDFEDVLDRDLGKVGTPKRDEFERKVDESVHAYRLGEAIKKARLQQNSDLKVGKRLQHNHTNHEQSIQGSWNCNGNT